MITKFKIFENGDHLDIDPYGEEDWKGELKDIDQPDFDWMDYEDTSLFCRLCGRISPSDQMLDGICSVCREDEAEEEEEEEEE